MLPLVDCKDLEDDEKIFGESYDSEEDDDRSEALSNTPEIQIQQYGSEDGAGSAESLKIGEVALPAQSDATPAPLMINNHAEDESGDDIFELRNNRAESAQDFKKTYE